MVAHAATLETPPRLLVDDVAIDASRVVAPYAIVADFLGAGSAEAELVRFEPAPPGAPGN